MILLGLPEQYSIVIQQPIVKFDLRTEKRIAQNIYIHNSNKSYRKFVAKCLIPATTAITLYWIGYKKAIKSV